MTHLTTGLRTSKCALSTLPDSHERVLASCEPTYGLDWVDGNPI